jgi:hypothetical protein
MPEGCYHVWSPAYLISTRHFLFDRSVIFRAPGRHLSHRRRTAFPSPIHSSRLKLHHPTQTVSLRTCLPRHRIPTTRNILSSSSSIPPRPLKIQHTCSSSAYTAHDDHSCGTGSARRASAGRPGRSRRTCSVRCARLRRWRGRRLRRRRCSCRRWGLWRTFLEMGVMERWRFGGW